MSSRRSVSSVGTFTLECGDMLWTGTSGTTPPINVGGDVTVEIDKIGVLHNPVEAA